jgi:hypothetical protein
MRHVNRVVIGVSEEKKSAVIYRDSPNQQGVPEIYWQCMLWAATELPVNNQIRGDRGADATGREPNENGLIFRALEIPPHIQDTKKVTEILQEVNKEVEQNHPPTAKDLARDPGMHRTDTCDMFVVAYGETYLVTDRDETLLKPGDSRRPGRQSRLEQQIGQAVPDHRGQRARHSVAQGPVPRGGSLTPACCTSGRP